MITISKPKLFAIAAILLVGSVSFYLGQVLAIPAPNTSTIIEPGSLNDVCDYLVYMDQPNTSNNQTLVKDCTTGANIISATTANSGIQQLMNIIVALGANPFPPPSGAGTGRQFHIAFGQGDFYIKQKITVDTGIGSGNGLALRITGQGEDKTALILDKGVNDDMFLINNIGDKFEMEFIKLHGQSAANTAGYGLHFTGSSTEMIFAHTELAYFSQGGILFDGTGGAWNVFTDVWFPGEPRGIVYGPNSNGYTDVKVIGCRFGPANNQGGLRFEVPVSRITITGSVFESSNIFDNSAGITNFAIVGNVFYSTLDQNIYFAGTGLAALKKLNGTISNNVFSTTTSTNREIYISAFIDGLTITNNQFTGFTRSTTVPISAVGGGTSSRILMNVRGNAGWNPNGQITNFVHGTTFQPWGVVTTIAASTDYTMVGTDMYISCTGGTSVSITFKDGGGNSLYAPGACASLTVPFYLPLGYKVNFGAFSVAPTTVTVTGD